MLKVKFSHTFDFLVHDSVLTDPAIGPCFVTIATFRDRKGARWLTPQLLPSAPSVKQRLVQLHGTKNARYDVTNESLTIKLVGDYLCHRFLSTTSINHCTPIGNIWYSSPSFADILALKPAISKKIL